MGHECDGSGRVSVRTPSRRSREHGLEVEPGSRVDLESPTMWYVPRNGSRDVVYNRSWVSVSFTNVDE